MVLVRSAVHDGSRSAEPTFQRRNRAAAEPQNLCTVYRFHRLVLETPRQYIRTLVIRPPGPTNQPAVGVANPTAQ